jgi:hypothetical protein
MPGEPKGCAIRTQRLGRALASIALGGGLAAGGSANAQAGLTAPAAAVESRPAPPNLDNLLPSQADALQQAYREALRRWQETRLAALRASAGAPLASIPPEPVRPDVAGLSPEEKQAAFQAYQKRREQWLEVARPAMDADDELKRKAGLIVGDPALRRLDANELTLPAGYSWRDEAAASGLGAETIAKLDHDSVAIAGPYFKQSFAVYNTSPQPPFVTSDSLLNGFHVLWEDSLSRFELSRARRLRAMLEEAWSGLDARLTKSQVPRSEIEPSARHLALVIGPPLRLLGSDLALGGPEVEATVAAEVKRIEAAEGIMLPPWLGPPDSSLAAIDYRRFRPIGFYAGDPTLARYYQATRWLQMIPFRASRDTEVGAAALLAALASDDTAVIGAYQPPALRQFTDEGAAVFGESDELGISAFFNGFPELLPTSGRKRQPMERVLDEIRQRMIAEARQHPRVVNDQLRPRSSAPANPGDASVRILPPALLPDAAWFAQLDRWRGREELPAGLEFAAWLGSPLATAEAAKSQPEGFSVLVDETRAAREKRLRPPGNVPALYYWALESLFAKPDPAAPAFMGGLFWQRKSLQTALAGWAQLRHAWELQAKYSEITFGMSLRPAGLVEPNPEFFQRMAAVVALAKDRMEEAGVLTDQPALRRRWEDLERLTRQLEALAEKQLRGGDWNREEAGVLKSYGETLAGIMGYDGNSGDRPRDNAPRWTTVAHDSNADRNRAEAVGRPRALYVLYPWKGQLVLCRGAVMSYYEGLSQQRLTDAEWQVTLDSSSPPPQPEWIRPLLPANP